MDNILKQRLVGALILLALGVVFWPIIFVEQDAVQTLGDPARLPHRPDINSSPITPASADGLRSSPALGDSGSDIDDRPANERATIAADKPTDNIAAAAEPRPAERSVVKTRSEPPVKPEIDADGVPVGWILQVASIASPEKAEELRSRLLAMGYKAYVKKVRSDDAVLLRVYVGPRFERVKLEAMQSAIDAEFGVQSMVRRYIP